MDEVEALVRALLGASGGLARRASASVTATLSSASWASTPEREPGGCSAGGAAAQPLGWCGRGSATGGGMSRDDWLELLMGALRRATARARLRLTFVHGYPASQAALARLDPADARVARRFELYCDGVELANGFRELASAAEQRTRFEADNAQRRRLGLPVFPLDERLLAALGSGLPDCAGVALGFERTLMLATGAERIEEVLPFPTARA